MRILVVDDDPLAGEMTAAVLEDGGHEVVLVDGGVAAGESLDGIELVVSDMNMPLVSGIELFRMMRQAGLDTPFILLSGEEPAGLLAAEPGLDACLAKDFTIETALPAAIEEVMMRRRFLAA
jgi:CheY-like chemotaxis protein